MENISPEEILRKRESESGIHFEEKPTPDKNLNPLEERIRKNTGTLESPVNSLGKSESYSPPGLEDGWKNLPLDLIPSKGAFYPPETRIAIRPAEVREIRHFSSIEEEDRLDINEKLNYILERCCRISFSGGSLADWRDVIQEDRFYIIMAIRDLTFIRGENKIILKPNKKCKGLSGCSFNGGFELKTGVLSSFSVEPKILDYYSSDERCFVFRLKSNSEKKIKMSIPTIGVTLAISNFLKECRTKKIEVDESFLKISPFIMKDWRGLDFNTIYNVMRGMDYWTKEEFSLYFTLSDKIKLGTKTEASLICPSCNDELKAPIIFSNGIKSLFVISDIFGELL